jgi:simple sugar transport system permease protein
VPGGWSILHAVRGQFWWGILIANITTVLAPSKSPLVLGAMCGLLCERSGVINIGIEGQMLMSAFLSFMFNVWTGNLFIAVLAGAATGALLGLLLAFMSVTLKIDQIIGGTVINILAVRLTGYFTRGLDGGKSADPVAFGRYPADWWLLFNNPPITYLTIVRFSW